MKASLLFLWVLSFATVNAQVVLHTAAASRSYRATGPSTPLVNQDALNVGGTSQGSFASWAAIDFTFSASDFGGPLAGVSQLALSVYKDDQSFTAGGVVNFYLAPMTTLALTDTTLKFNSAFTGGIDPTAGTLGALYDLGNATVVQSNGATDGQLATFVFTVDAATSSFIATQINSGDHVLRVVMTPGAASTVVSFAGLTSPNFGDPALTVTAVPEPGAWGVVLGSFALVGCWLRLRRSFRFVRSGTIGCLSALLVVVGLRGQVIYADFSPDASVTASHPYLDIDPLTGVVYIDGNSSLNPRIQLSRNNDTTFGQINFNAGGSFLGYSISTGAGSVPQVKPLNYGDEISAATYLVNGHDIGSAFAPDSWAPGTTAYVGFHFSGHYGWAELSRTADAITITRFAYSSNAAPIYAGQTAVPEPSTAAVALGVAALIGAYFAKRARKAPSDQMSPSRLAITK